jgi:hypothetical protein
MIRSSFINFFSTPAVSRLVVLICIISKSILIFYYSYVGKDKIYHLAAANNLLSCKGWTTSSYLAENINQEILTPFCYWPPGYGLLMAPLQSIFKTNIFLSTTLFEIFCFIAFILLCRAILKTQGVGPAWLNTATLLLSFFSHDFIEVSLGTDFPALCFLLGFLFLIIKVWQCEDPRKKIIRMGVSAGLCLFFAGFIRYPYAPAAILISALMVLAGYWQKHRPALPGLWACAITGVAGLAIAAIFQTATCGSPFYITKSETGIYFHNWLYWHPAAVSAFINPDFASVQLGKITSVSYLNWMMFFSKANLVIYFLLLIAAGIYFFKKRKGSGFSIFYFSGFCLAFAIVAELALLSLTHSTHISVWGYPWTFISEGRYHAFFLVFLQLLFFKELAFYGFSFSGKNLKKFFLSGLFILLIAESFHQVYITSNVALNYKNRKAAVSRERDYLFFEKLLIQIIKENPEKEILVASTDKYYPLLASIHDKKGLADHYKLNDAGPAVSKPAILFTVILQPEQKYFSNYTGRKDVSLLKVINETKFYMQYLFPNTTPSANNNP